MKSTLGGIGRIEILPVEPQGLLQCTAHLGILRFKIQLRKSFHQMKMSIGTLATRHLDRHIFLRRHDRRPIGREMFEPPAMLIVVRFLLQDVKLLHRLTEYLSIVGRSIVFHQAINDEGLTIDHFVLVRRMSLAVGRPIVTAVLTVQEVLHQELIPLSGSGQVVTLWSVKFVPMRVRESPNHPRLGDKLFGVGFECVAAILPVYARIVPERHRVISQLLR